MLVYEVVKLMASFSDDLVTNTLKVCAIVFVYKCQNKSIANLTNEYMEKKCKYVTMSQTHV